LLRAWLEGSEGLERIERLFAFLEHRAEPIVILRQLPQLKFIHRPAYRNGDDRHLRRIEFANHRLLGVLWKTV
jgi:hypothetical protein